MSAHRCIGGKIGDILFGWPVLTRCVKVGNAALMTIWRFDRPAEDGPACLCEFRSNLTVFTGTGRDVSGPMPLR